MGALDRFLAGQFARPRGWLGRFWIGPWLDRISGPMNRLAVEQMRLAGDEDVLEVGFGGGALLAMIVERSCGQVTGIDLSAAMVARARRRFHRFGRVRLAQASVESLPLPSASVDVACSVNNIYFWPDPAAAMAELARVVRPGGTLSLCFEPPEELRKWPGHRFGFRLFEEKEVRGLMENAGFGEFRREEGHGLRPDFFLCLTGRRQPEDAAE